MITSPEEVKTNEQKVADARNTLSSLEQDYIRIQGLKVSEEYTLGEARKAKLEIETFIIDLSSKKDKLIKEVSTLETSRNGLTTDLQVLSQEILETQTEKSNLIQEVLSIQLEHKNQSIYLTDREKEVSKREKLVDIKETSLNDKLEIIKNFKTSL
jgi:chromosome segregation ATPase